MSNREEKETLKNSSNVPDTYAEENLPVEFLVEKHTNDLIEDPEGMAVVLFAAIATNVGGQMSIATIASTLFIGKDAGIKDEDAALASVGKFAAFIHPVIIQPSMPKGKHRPVLSPRELMEFRCQNMRVIDMFLYGVATGNSQVDTDKILSAGNQDHQSNFLAAAVVSSDVMMRGRVPHPLECQLMLKEVLHRQRVTGEFHLLASALHLAPSKTYQMKTRHDEVVKRMKNGIKLNPRDLVLILFDNIGYKVLGRQASYDQWIVVNIVVITEAELKKLGFYVHDDDPSMQISREASVNWEEKINAATTDEMKLALAEPIIGITQDDNNKLAECIMNDIQVAIDYNETLMNDNHGVGAILPRIDLIINSETRKAMEDRKTRKGCDNGGRSNQATVTPSSTQHVDLMPRDHAPTDVTDEIGGNVLGHVVGDNEEGNTDDEEEENADHAETEAAAKTRVSKNRYQRNNGTKLQMVKADLNKTSSVEKLMKYGADSQKQQIEQWNKIKDSLSPTAEEPVAMIMNALGTDGQPAAQASKILRDDDGKTFPKSTLVSFGGLHTVMKTLNANGEFFEPLLREVVSSIRDSLDKQNWFLFPSDPRQREQEYPLLALAHYLVAYKELEEVEGRNVSAKEVHEFMLERGEDHATCAFALLELRMGAIAKMMRCSERLGKEEGVKLFFTTLKFALRLFTITHKTEYVCLGCDLLRWYYCASPAQRKIYDNCIFTQTTSKGVSVFHDYFVELSVKDLREFTGKVYYQGLGAELEYLTATIPERDGERNDARTLRDKDATSRSSDRYGIRINEYLGKLVTKITEMKLWKAGEDPVVRGEKTSETITCSSDVITLPGGVELPSLNLSSIMDVGGQRLDRYFVRWYIDSYGAVERSEKGLAKLKTTKKDLKAAMDLDIKLATSTSDLMVRECTKELLLIQIERMRDRNKARPKNNKQLRIPDDKLDKNTKKGIIVDFLTTWRIKEFRAFPKLKGTLVNQIMKERGDSNVILEADRKKLMGSEFFSLSKYMEGNDAYSSIHE